MNEPCNCREVAAQLSAIAARRSAEDTMGNLSRMQVVFTGPGGARAVEWKLQSFLFQPGEPIDVPAALGERLVDQDVFEEYIEPVVEEYNYKDQAVVLHKGEQIVSAKEINKLNA